MIEKIASIPGIRITTWKIGVTYYTFDQLEELYNSIGQELFAYGVDTGDYKPPDQYNLPTHKELNES